MRKPISILQTSAVWRRLALCTLTALTTAATLVLIDAAGRRLAQQDLPRFDVAAISRSDSNSRIVALRRLDPGGRVRFVGYTLTQLIHDAYDVDDFRIQGGAAWTGTQRFDITAKPPAGSPASQVNPAQFKDPLPDDEILMLRSLLAARFQLRVEQTSTPGPGYHLVMAAHASKLSPPHDPNEYPVVLFGPTATPDRPVFLEGHNATMSVIARRLGGLLQRPVLDQTGISGTYDFHIEFAESDSVGPSLFSVLPELGLKLVAAQCPVPRILILSAQPPSAN